MPLRARAADGRAMRAVGWLGLAAVAAAAAAAAALVPGAAAHRCVHDDLLAARRAEEASRQRARVLRPGGGLRALDGVSGTAQAPPALAAPTLHVGDEEAHRRRLSGATFESIRIKPVYIDVDGACVARETAVARPGGFRASPVPRAAPGAGAGRDPNMNDTRSDYLRNTLMPAALAQCVRTRPAARGRRRTIVAAAAAVARPPPQAGVRAARAAPDDAAVRTPRVPQLHPVDADQVRAVRHERAVLRLHQRRQERADPG
jgi:hypothetical protein